MTKKIGLSVAAAALLASTHVVAAENLSEAFTNAKMTGTAQLFYQSMDGGLGTNATGTADEDISITDRAASDATAGLTIKLVTEEYNGLTLGMSYVYLNTLGLEHNMVEGVVNTPAGSANNEEANTLNGGYFSEFYLQKAIGKTIVKVGNQEIHTPLVNSDMWAVAPNTFGAGVLINQDIEGITLVAAHVATEKTRTGAQFSTFYANGADAFGAVINSIDKTPIQVWYYSAEQTATALYADVKADLGDFKIAAQYGSIMPSDFGGGNADDTTALGLKVSANVGADVWLAASQVGGDAGTGSLNFTNLGDGGTKTPLFTQTSISSDGDIVGATDTTSISIGASMKMDAHTLSAQYVTSDHGDKSSAKTATGDNSTTIELRAVSGWSDTTKTFLALGQYDHTVGFFNGEADTANTFMRFWMKYSF